MEKAQEKLALITKYFGDFTPTQLQQFGALEELYTDWNSKINVISRKDMESLYEKHVLHSLSIAAAFEMAPGLEVVDLGTGGGFPGIPLAIFYPEVRFHLVDSIGKKIKVVQAVSEALGLQNVTSQHSRIEDLKNRKFDYVVSRAVAPLQNLWQWSKPLLKKVSATQHRNPGLICLKGGDLTVEIAESGCKPTVLEMFEIFPEEYFKEKYLLFVPNT
ncbi:16S rRNA (guanine(527)-N(7))-methyltransferase RsmG [Paraflavitalea sp. CAU 1676]|uniref:16S rRNA (guanine(527)-N(7))-methyltransferase RsmG n=1 Tax=Paraflavitalea sp. CAU 1676 TaxID=3032598 RepID=UPI0023DCD835|nr:16S rRNA (guanine(527)-N(7))-methyltransferase RsmG [Paraflavitalea sp. CAU 1676]MDF2187573.1 16S rRNA (guanine(527)-N(7))-methyltransferase RsmG [Paraflavitalea sp. CAU 1676]